MPGDLPAGFAVQSDRYGRQLDDSPNRDVCGRALAGDAHRLSARQLVLTGDGRRVTGEVASYERGGAADVLRQLRESVDASARAVPAPHLLRGVQSLERRYTVAATRAGHSSLAVLAHRDRPGRHRRRSEVVYQRRGEVLSVLTVDPVDGDGDELLRRTASVLGARLHRPGDRRHRVESTNGHSVVHGIPFPGSSSCAEGSRPPPATDPNPRTAT